MHLGRHKRKKKFSLKIIEFAFLFSFILIVIVLIKFYAPKWRNNPNLRQETSPNFQVYELNNESIHQVFLTVNQLSKEKTEKFIFHLSAKLFREIVYTQKSIDKGSHTATSTRGSSKSLKSYHKLKVVRVRRSSNQPYHALQEESFFDDKEQRLHELLMGALDQDELIPFRRQFDSQRTNNIPENHKNNFKEKLELENRKTHDSFLIFSKAEEYCQNKIMVLE